MVHPRRRAMNQASAAWSPSPQEPPHLRVSSPSLVDAPLAAPPALPPCLSVRSPCEEPWTRTHASRLPDLLACRISGQQVETLDFRQYGNHNLLNSLTRNRHFRCEVWVLQNITRRWPLGRVVQKHRLQ